MDVIPKVPEKLWAQLIRFPSNFLNFLFSPNIFFSSVKEKSEANGSDLIIATFSFAFICLSVGAAVGGYLNLSGGPQLFDIQVIIFVLFVWCITAVLLHPFLKLFRASGTALQTMIVVLFASSALHIIWIPIFSIISNVITETRVVLTYDYAISYSVASKRNWSQSEGMILSGAEGLAEFLAPDYSESYVIEREPEKEGTVLPPAPKPVGRDEVTHRFDPERVAIGSSDYPTPERLEQAVLGPHSTPFLASILALYLLSHIVYLGVGFSKVHGRTPLYWISLAILIPIALVVIIIGGLVAFILLI